MDVRSPDQNVGASRGLADCTLRPKVDDHYEVD